MISAYVIRVLKETSFKPLYKAAWLYMLKGYLSAKAFKRRRKRGKNFPPFIFIALTDACNLRCQGCWVEKEGTTHTMTEDNLEAIIVSGKKKRVCAFTLLGGEPMMYKDIMKVFARHPDAYFQIITNGMMFTDKNTAELKRLGNVSPLVSLDGFEKLNDQRRGKGVYASIVKGLVKLKKNGLVFGIATTATALNYKEVLSDEYVESMTQQGALYLWYYIYRPVGPGDHKPYCMSAEQILEMRKTLLVLRKKHPILIIDSYWTAEGEAFCPAANGLGYHIGPSGSIEICPPLSFATSNVSDNGGDLAKTIQESSYLNGFEKFVKERTCGCVILEHPQELSTYIKGHGAKDYSGRDAYSEISGIVPGSSHHLPNQEIPENYWVYKFMKKQFFS